LWGAWVRNELSWGSEGALLIAQVIIIFAH